MPPPYPNQPPSGSRDPQGAPWPGLIPLRPLGILEILTASVRLVRAHAAVLCVVALVGSLLSAGSVYTILALLPDNSAYFSDQWLNSLSAGRFSAPPAAFIWPLAAGAAISFITTIVVSGLATAFAADDALGRPITPKAAFARLQGRWAVLVGVSVLVGLLVFLGFLAFVIPGFVVLAMLLLATPIAVLEKAGVGAALRRSVLLSAGMRGRVLGITVLAYLISTLVGTVVVAIVPVSSTLSAALLALVVQALVSAVTVPWTAGVVALLYIDTRIRKENLAASLIRASMRS